MNVDRTVYERAIETARERGADYAEAVDHAVHASVSYLIKRAASAGFELSAKDFEHKGSFTILRIDGMNAFDWMEAMIMD